MQKISEAVVEKCFESLAALGPEKTEALLEAFQQDQPEAFDYLMSVGEDILEEPERETLVLTGTLLWEIMRQQGGLPKVSGETLDQQEAAQFKLLEALNQTAPGMLSQAAEKMLDNYHQEHLLALVEDLVLFPDPEDPDDIDDDNRPWLFVFLKTLIDCWDG